MKRCLRWSKFLLCFLLLWLLWSALLPQLALAATLLHTPYIESPAPLLPALLGALLCIAAALGLCGELLWGLQSPRLLLPFLLLALLAPGWTSAFVAPSHQAPALLSADSQLRSLLAKLATFSACHLEKGGSLNELPDLEAAALRLLPKTSFRDRLGRRLRPRLLVLQRAAGPRLQVEAGDRPGSLYLAIHPSGKVGWWSAVTWGETGPAILRKEGRALVQVVSPAAPPSGPCPSPSS